MPMMRCTIRLAIAWLACAACVGSSCVGPRARPEGPLHVASPDWRDQVVYFAMIDRFDDGDPHNNDQGTGEYDPRDGAKFSGGDLRGLTRRLGYIQGLGATALWITPPVANQWWNARVQYGGYHGYWAEDFTRIDAHFGNEDDYRALSRALHARGMYLVQDIVVNHTGDWFGSPDLRDPRTPSTGFRRHADGRGHLAPTQPPFDRNDARDPAQRSEGIYHWTPDIGDHVDRDQELNYQLAGLDDLDTENTIVRDALRDAYGHWIRDAGVDAYRVDTAFYVPPTFFADFLHAKDPAHPGIEHVARATGRAGFLAFGEGFGIDRAYSDAQARRIDGYMRAPGGLPSMINFPLYGTLGDVFLRGRPTAELGHRIGSMMRVHADPWRMPTFIDNHDVDRFLATGDATGLRQALLAMLTLPGIPVIYYGTEQAFDVQRAAMFAGGFGAGGRDRFDTGAPLYRYLQGAIALRRAHRVFSRGTPTVLRETAAGPGAFAYRMDHEGVAALVVFNTSDAPVLLDNLELGMPQARLQGAFAIDGKTPGDIASAARFDVVLPPRSGQVWLATRHDAADSTAPPAGVTLDPLRTGTARGDFDVSGRAPALSRVQVVVDGDLARARSVAVATDGRWRARIATDDMIDAAVPHRVVAWSGVPGSASAAQMFHVSRDWRLLADVTDPAGDDHGRAGRYAYPLDPGWSQAHPLDLLGVRAWTSGGALRLALRMRGISTQWSPPNGFDHVAFTVFVQLPGRADGVRAMPLQNAELPDGMRWHARLRAHGWSNALFASQGASPTHEGAPARPGAGIRVEGDIVEFTFPAAAFGHVPSLSGAKVHVATWDYDGGYRALSPEAGAMTFGGGDGTRDPLVMDEATITLK